MAIVWWAIIAPMLVKLPNDIDTQMDFEGNLTVYVNPDDGQPLPDGQEMAVPSRRIRTFVALPDLFTSGTAVFEDTLVLTAAGEASPPQVSHYALDRKSRKCVDQRPRTGRTPKISR